MNEEDAKVLSDLQLEVARLSRRVDALETQANQEPEDRLRRGWLLHRENARRLERGM